MTRAPDMPPGLFEPWPAFILARPQMGENIGAVARAMLNFGFSGLRLVEPRDAWPNPKAFAVASGADAVLSAAKVEWRLEDAIAECTLLVAATARPRALEKPVWSPREAAEKIMAARAAGETPALLFGPEASGLETDEVARADAVVTFPVNPDFPSLNLSNAAAMMAFCLGEARHGAAPPPWFKDTHARPATHDELRGMFEHLESELDRGRFFHPEDKAPLMKNNIRAPFLRARLTEQEVRTFRGIIKALTIGRGGRKKPEAPGEEDEH